MVDESFCNHAIIFSVRLAGVCGGVKENRIEDRSKGGDSDRCLIGEQAGARFEEGDDARAGKRL